MKVKPRYIEVEGKRVVMLAVKEYERLAKIADVWEPTLPEPNKDGNYPIEAMEVIVARGILRDRRKLGWTQAELAQRAGLRVGTLNRIEHGKIPRRGRAIDKIDRALKAAQARNGNHKTK